MHRFFHRWTTWHLLLVSLVLVAACAVYALRLSGPLIHHHDWTVAEFSLSARNTLRYGLLTTRFGQVTNVETVAPEDFGYYIHTPPGLVFAIAGMFRLIGYHAYAARLVAVFMTLLADSALYALARRLYGRSVGLWCLILFAFTPSTAYFGPMVEYDSMMVAIMLLVLGFYLTCLRGSQGVSADEMVRARHAAPLRQNRQVANQKARANHPAVTELAARWKRAGWLPPILALAVAGVWSGWLMVVFLPLLWLHAHTLGSRATRRGMWLAGVVALAAVGLLIASFAWQRPDFLAELGSIVRSRTGNASPAGQIFTPTGSQTFTWLDWLKIQSGRVLWMFTPTVVGLALYGAFRSWRSVAKSENALVTVLLLTSLIYVVIVRQASFIHEYLLFTLGAPLATWSAWALVALWRRWRRALILRAALVLLVMLYGVASVRWTVGFYHYRTQPQLAALGQELGARTQPGERIATDLAYPGPVPAFYADRAIDYGVAPDDDVLADRRADWYLYCAEDQAISPDWPDSYRRASLLDCELVRLH